jgi:NAD(P)H-nitrite reductase large subunit
MISDRAKQIYRTLLQHSQLITGAVYGATTDMQALLRLLSEEAEKSVSLVPSKAEADKVYQRWQAEQ